MWVSWTKARGPQLRTPWDRGCIHQGVKVPRHPRSGREVVHDGGDHDAGLPAQRLQGATAAFLLAAVGIGADELTLGRADRDHRQDGEHCLGGRAAHAAATRPSPRAAPRHAGWPRASPASSPATKSTVAKRPRRPAAGERGNRCRLGSTGSERNPAGRPPDARPQRNADLAQHGDFLVVEAGDRRVRTDVGQPGRAHRGPLAALSRKLIASRARAARRRAGRARRRRR